MQCHYQFTCWDAVWIGHAHSSRKHSMSFTLHSMSSYIAWVLPVTWKVIGTCMQMRTCILIVLHLKLRLCQRVVDHSEAWSDYCSSAHTQHSMLYFALSSGGSVEKWSLDIFLQNQDLKKGVIDWSIQFSFLVWNRMASSILFFPIIAILLFFFNKLFTKALLKMHRPSPRPLFHINLL